MIFNVLLRMSHRQTLWICQLSVYQSSQLWIESNMVDEIVILMSSVGTRKNGIDMVLPSELGESLSKIPMVIGVHSYRQSRVSITRRRFSPLVLVECNGWSTYNNLMIQNCLEETWVVASSLEYRVEMKLFLLVATPSPPHNLSSCGIRCHSWHTNPRVRYSLHPWFMYFHKSWGMPEQKSHVRV